VKFTSTIVDATEYSTGDLIDTTRSHGSTSTTDVIKFSNDNNFENTVIFTDGYIFHDKTQQPNGNVLWVIDATGRCPAAGAHMFKEELQRLWVLRKHSQFCNAWYEG
jgi:predicted metal-dependent peptidase